MYRFEGTGFSNIPQLIDHHYTTKQVITKKSGVILLNPIPKVGAYIQFFLTKEKRKDCFANYVPH